MKVPAFADIGKQAADILYGTKKSGQFQYDTKFNVNLKTTGAMTAVRKTGGDALSTDFKLSYAEKGVSLETQPALKKATIKYSHAVMDGLKLSAETSAPEPNKDIKVTADYAQPYFTSKASMIIAKNPLVNLAAATGYNGWVLGASAVLDPRGSKLSAVEGAASYVGPDFVATAHTTPTFKKIRGTYWQQLDAASSVAAEVVHVPDDKKVDLNMAYCHFDVLKGVMHKVKFGNDGSVHLHRETKLRTDTSVGLSLCVNALNLSAEPKLGLCVDHSP